MASREEMSLLRAARAGQAGAQIALAKHYLFGGATLPQSVMTSLYWLERAARQGEPDAWALIGTHIPFEVALRAQDRHSLYEWYERAFDDGVIHAGLVLARLVLTVDDEQHEASLRRKAWQALECAAELGVAEAQWLLAQLLEKKEVAANAGGRARRKGGAYRRVDCPYLEWARRAADNGVLPARRMLANHAWGMADDRQYLYWALPIAHSIATCAPHGEPSSRNLSGEDIELLSRCAQALFRTGEFTASAIEKLAEPAACAGERWAQFYLGLWFAKMDETGRRMAGTGRLINYRKAIHWLTLAGQQRVADAWYIVSRIYLKPEFAHRSIADAETFLGYAAEGGHPAAQLELGKRLWRKRRTEKANDVRAAHWLQKAASQGCSEAGKWLQKIAPPATPAPWAQEEQFRTLSLVDPFTAARVKLAACFGLSEREALLLDVIAADRGHCVEVDIRDQCMRSKRRLILIRTGEERWLLDQIKSVFEGMDCGPHGTEGNFRQRLYRLRNALATKKSRRSRRRRESGEAGSVLVTYRKSVTSCFLETAMFDDAKQAV